MKGCRPFSHKEENAIIESLALSRNGVRDVALFELGIETGFRITELLSVRLGGRYGLLQEGKIGRTLKVQRKRMKRSREGRTIYLTPRAKQVIRPLLPVLRAAGTCLSEHFVFQGTKPGNTPLVVSTAWRIIRNGAERAGVTPERVGTHSLRKTFARRYYGWLLERARKGAIVDPMRELMKALGQKSIEATEAYLDWDDHLLAEYLERERPRHDQPELF